jgi:hypothetical protein
MLRKYQPFIVCLKEALWCSNDNAKWAFLLIIISMGWDTFRVWRDEAESR